MKVCSMKFIIREDLVQIIAERFRIDLDNKQEANKKLGEFIVEYITNQVKIAEAGAEIQVADHG